MTKPSPYASMMPAAKNQYHGIASVNKFGAIQHGHAIAQCLVARGDAPTELDALVQATHMVQQLEAVSQGALLHKEAHERLLAAEKLKALNSGAGAGAGMPGSSVWGLAP